MTPDELRAVIRELELTQAEFAEKIGVSARAVRYWLSGQRRIPKTVELLVRTLLR
jgi:DNA-binding transcriptional regulator YiaG